MSIRIRHCCALLPLIAGACTVGPNYKGAPMAAPLAVAAGRFRRAPVAPVDAAPPPARWWEALGDPLLTRLIERGFAASPTLQQAEARIREARAALSKSRANEYPSVSATALGLKARLPTASVSGATGNSLAGTGTTTASSTAASGSTASAQPTHQTLSLYTVGFDATWEIDLFGGNRRAVEGARAQTEAAAAKYEDSEVQLAAEIGQTYVALRDAQARLALGQQASVTENRMLALTLERRRLGTADDLDVERLRTQLNQTDANNVPLTGQIEEALDQLAMLVGQEAGTLDAELSPPRPLPLPPAIVAVGDPAAMLRQRPDIRAAERQLAVGNAAIGENIAKLFPKVELLGNVGLSSSNLGDLFAGRNFGIIGAPTLQWNFLDFGRVRAQIRQARATNDEDLAAYRGTVLMALQDAEDSLSKFGHQRDTLVQLGHARDSATRSAALERVRYAAGTASLIDFLDTERQRLQAEQSREQAAAELSKDYMALQKSLGLGWQPIDASGSAPSRPPAS